MLAKRITMRSANNFQLVVSSCFALRETAADTAIRDNPYCIRRSIPADVIITWSLSKSNILARKNHFLFC